jgi:hypothetical protein
MLFKSRKNFNILMFKNKQKIILRKKVVLYLSITYFIILCFYNDTLIKNIHGKTYLCEVQSQSHFIYWDSSDFLPK